MRRWFEVKKEGKHTFVEFEHDGEVTFWNPKGDECNMPGMATVRLELGEVTDLYHALIRATEEIVPANRKVKK